MKAIFSIILAATPCFAQFTPTNCDFAGVVGCYPFISSPNDLSTNQNHGQIQGPVGVPDRFTNAFGAYFFDGENDEIRFGNRLKPRFPLTISAWILYHDIPGSPFYGIFRNGNWGGGSYHGLHFGINPEGNGRSHLYVAVGDGGFPAADARRQKQATGADGIAVITNQWTHVAAVLRSTSDFKLYVNGVEVTGTYSGTGGSVVNDSTTSRLGVSNTGSGGYRLRGMIDDFCIFSRALTAEEIVSLVNAPNPGLVDSDGDTYTDLEELRSGSGPCDVQDALSFSIHRSVELRFLTKTGLTYKVQYSSNLADWFDYGTMFPGTGGLVSQFVSTEDTHAQFFRGVVPPQ